MLETTLTPTLPNTQTNLDRIIERYPIILQLLRFIAIGVINTALDFIILNLLSKALAINSGTSLGGINILSFSLAVVQSYFWNHYWTFATAKVTLRVNFMRLVLVAGIGFASFAAVILGAKLGASPIYYFVTLLLFIVFELGLWIAFKLREAVPASPNSREFVIFVAVSIIGLLINTILVALVSSYLSHTSGFGLNTDLLKNLAKVVATLVSLVWNFVGYKLFVFKR